MADADRNQSPRSWLESATSPWICATSALGTGDDVPNIVAVVHCGLPYGLVDYAQQSGRAGRDGTTPVKSIILDDGCNDDASQLASEYAKFSADALRAYLRDSVCRRASLAVALDGQEGSTCSSIPDCLPCDLCKRPPSPVQCPPLCSAPVTLPGLAERAVPLSPPSSAPVTLPDPVEEAVALPASEGIQPSYTADQQAIGRLTERFYDFRDKGGLRCLICLYREKTGRTSTCKNQQRCHLQANSNGAYTIPLLRKTIQYAPYSCCFVCKMPLAICKTTGGADLKIRCRVEDVVTPVLLQVILGDKLAVAKYRELSGSACTASNKKKFLKWCGMSNNYMGTKCSNSFRLFAELVSKFPP